MTIGFLEFHLQMQHGRATGRRWYWGTKYLGRETCTYNKDFPNARGPSNCPVKGCQVQVVMRTAMWVHLFHRHDRDTVIVLE